MPRTKKNKSVVAICVQEPFEEGSSMELAPITEDDIRFLHQAFISDTIVNALQVPDIDVRLYYKDLPERKKLVKIVTDYLKKKLADQEYSFTERFSSSAQEDKRWGIRMEEVFKECFNDGYERVLLIGSRTPTFTPKMIERALSMLGESDAIFGPTPEGRYYTLGMSGSYKIELSKFDWKDSAIYSQVAEAFEAGDLNWAELPIWYAVESSDELEIMTRDINQYRFEGDELTARETELVMERILAKF